MVTLGASKEAAGDGQDVLLLTWQNVSSSFKILFVQIKGKSSIYFFFYKVLHCSLCNDESDTVFQVLFICTV